MAYEISSHGYAQRARSRLDEGTNEALFYAAFELRAGVQTRLNQYLENQDNISRKAKEGYRIEPLAKMVEKAFRTGNKVIKVTMRPDDEEAVPDVFYFTPVSPSLKKKAEKLGNYLHAMQRLRTDNDPWWKTTRRFLEETYAELVEANRGELVGPPLRNRENGTVHIYWQGPSIAEKPPRYIGKSYVGTQMVFEVEYLDRHPDAKK